MSHSHPFWITWTSSTGLLSLARKSGVTFSFSYQCGHGVGAKREKERHRAGQHERGCRRVRRKRAGDQKRVTQHPLATRVRRLQRECNARVEANAWRRGQLQRTFHSRSRVRIYKYSTRSLFTCSNVLRCLRRTPHGFVRHLLTSFCRSCRAAGWRRRRTWRAQAARAGTRPC